MTCVYVTSTRKRCQRRHCHTIFLQIVRNWMAASGANFQHHEIDTHSVFGDGGLMQGVLSRARREHYRKTRVVLLHEVKGKNCVAVVHVGVLSRRTRTPNKNILLQCGLGQGVEWCAVDHEPSMKKCTVCLLELLP